MAFENLPKMWPKHFDEAIQALNRRLFLSLDFSLKELLLEWWLTHCFQLQ